MAEYAGSQVKVTLEPDSLVIARSGLEAAQARISGEAPVRRVPLTMIREVHFRDAGFRDGVLWLVLEGKDSPEKLSNWKAMDAEDAITFRSGKQAKRMRELHEFLQQVVAENREREPMLDQGAEIEVLGTDEKSEARRLDVFRDLGLRDDLAAASVGLDMLPKMVKRALSAASSCLSPDEGVEAVTTGAQGVAGKATILVLTNRRVFAVRDGGSAASEEMSRSEITSVAWQEGVVGRLDIVGNGRTITVRAPDKRATEWFVSRIRNSVTQTPTAPTFSVPWSG